VETAPLPGKETAMTDLSTLTPGTWTIDSAHSTVGFVARHLMITKVRGRFTDFSGAIEVAPDPLQSRVEATVDLRSVDTGDEKRDAHLRSADFFDVEGGASPTMTFQSTGIKDDDGDSVLFGDLTINGVTRQVEFALEFEGVNIDPWGNTKAAFSAETEINRKDFGIEWNVALETGGVLVGDTVKVELDIQAVKA
jgi:polyisoprenoid-binding protein YceI